MEIKLYKVTAKAPDLIQRTAENRFTEEYVHYLPKPKAHEGDVYYDFNELVKAMQANPTGTFKLGSNMNANNVPPAGKSYVTNAFKGSLGSLMVINLLFIISLNHYLETSKVVQLRISY